MDNIRQKLENQDTAILFAALIAVVAAVLVSLMFSDSRRFQDPPPPISIPVTTTRLQPDDLGEFLEENRGHPTTSTSWLQPGGTTTSTTARPADKPVIPPPTTTTTRPGGPPSVPPTTVPKPPPTTVPPTTVPPTTVPPDPQCRPIKLPLVCLSSDGEPRSTRTYRLPFWARGGLGWSESRRTLWA